jgi:hypothetical protein
MLTDQINFAISLTLSFTFFLLSIFFFQFEEKFYAC